MDPVQRQIRRQLLAEQRRDTLEAEYKAAKAEAEHNATVVTPTVLAEAGVQKLETRDHTVALRAFVQGSIDKEAPQPAYDQIEADGEGHLLKYEVIIQFDKDQLDQAKVLVAKLEKMKGVPTPQVKLSVHPSSLKAYLRRHYLDTGFPLMTVFRGGTGLKAHIKPKKNERS